MIEHLTRPVVGASEEVRRAFGRSLLAALDRIHVGPGQSFVLAKEQAQLEDLEASHTPVRNDGSVTSRDAALEAYPKSGTQRHWLFKKLGGHGEFGATREELAAQTGLPGNSVRPRIVDLIRGGWVMVTDRTRKTPLGNDSEVLVLTTKGQHEYLENEREWRAA